MSSPSTSPLRVRAARPSQRPRSLWGVVPTVVMLISNTSWDRSGAPRPLPVPRAVGRGRYSHRINGATLKIKRLQKMALGLLVVLALGACGGAGQVQHGVARNVFLIVMENHSASEALAGQFTASLAAMYGVANDYRSITHSSVPNYLALTSGSTWGVTDDSYHALPKQDLGTQLTSAGVTWRAYMAGLGDGGCLNSPVPYDPRPHPRGSHTRPSPLN